MCLHPPITDLLAFLLLVLNSSQIKRIREWLSNEIFLLIRNSRKQEVGWVKVKGRGWKEFWYGCRLQAVMGNFLSREQVTEEVRYTQDSFLYSLARSAGIVVPALLSLAMGEWNKNGRAAVTTGPHWVEVNEGITPGKKRNCACVRTRGVATDAKPKEPRPDAALKLVSSWVPVRDSETRMYMLRLSRK